MKNPESGLVRCSACLGQGCSSGCKPSEGSYCGGPCLCDACGGRRWVPGLTTNAVDRLAAARKSG